MCKIHEVQAAALLLQTFTPALGARVYLAAFAPPIIVYDFASTRGRSQEGSPLCLISAEGENVSRDKVEIKNLCLL